VRREARHLTYVYIRDEIKSTRAHECHDGIVASGLALRRYQHRCTQLPSPLVQGLRRK